MKQQSLIELLLNDGNNKIINSFYPKDSLSTDIFNNNKINDKVRNKLISISNEFLDFLGVDFFVHDIVLTGSLASYGWSEFSDIDLHIILDYDESEHNNELLNQFFEAKKDSWNNLHNIKIKNYDVEIYVQDMKEEHVSSGVYSILNNKWVIEPEKSNINIDEKKIISKSEEYIRQIDNLSKKFNNGENIEKDSKKLKDKIKGFRKCGLSKDGEYSYENLVFKYLRRNGYLKKLIDLKIKNLDKKLSINDQQILNEDFKSQKQRFINQGYDESIVNNYLSYFKEIKDKKYKQVFDNIHGVNINGNDRINIDTYKNFKELELVVDYVRGQVHVKGNKINEELIIDGKPIFENNVFEIYYADSAHACVKYKGNIPYSWCVSRRDSGNMYTSYRYREHQPAFYFVKIKDRTKKELGLLSLLKSGFSGSFKDPYHFFVVQVIYTADVKNKNNEQYLVTSANNDGDHRMSWNNLLDIEPRLNSLQEYFKPVPHSDQEKKDWREFKKGIDDETYCKLPYERKRTYLDIIILNKEFSDGKWGCTPYDLKNFYVGLGKNLSEYQFGDIKSDRKLYNRYKDISERLFVEMKNEKINDLGTTQYMVLSDDKKLEYIKIRISNGYRLSSEHYNLTPDELKLGYIKMMISKGMSISDEQYNLIPYNLKLEYIKMCGTKGYLISTELYNLMPDELKLEYIKMMMLNENSFSDELYNLIPDNFKLEYMEMIMSKGRLIPSEQYNLLSDELKLEYMKMLLSKGFKLSSEHYNLTPDELKLGYIKMMISKGMSISDEQYNLIPDNLKLEYIKMYSTKGYLISDEQYNLTPDNLKLEYLKIRLSKGYELSDKKKQDYEKLKGLYEQINRIKKNIL